ncbi:unnamed protein product [Candidula unifasciata]|uniref:Uncharacterized protein n=1 Tax=Candidula unifasciata TaxID=100452 RepID=A0A8S3Z1B6_9EUPU|nr:unnamed protein product [Candidula unifasciata]
MSGGYVIVCGGYVIVSGGYVIVGDGYVIVDSGYVIVGGGFVIVGGGYVIMGGGFVIVGGGYVIVGGGYVIVGGGYVTLSGGYITVSGEYVIVGGGYVIVGGGYVIVGGILIGEKFLGNNSSISSSRMYNATTCIYRHLSTVIIHRVYCCFPKRLLPLFNAYRIFCKEIAGLYSVTNHVMLWTGLSPSTFLTVYLSKVWLNSNQSSF